MSTQQALPPAGVDPEVVEREDKRWTPLRIAIWVIIALIGAVAWSMLAFSRGETINAIWFVFAAVATYLIAYRFYAKYIERKIA
ncbi:MAG TPA: carbon starvation protein A, partial [Micrococcaceae bacterium]|nr:carbon starvation protein A [Micrococcaceae bacterium]